MSSEEHKPQDKTSIRIVLWSRRIVQTAAVVAFLALIRLTDYGPGGEPAGPGGFFFQIDPLVLVDTIVTNGTIETGLLLGLITLGFTFLFGRFFCGWVCPMGAIHNLVTAFRKSKKSVLMRTERWTRVQRWKYIGLVALLLSGFCGFHILGWLDPLSFLERGVALSFYPAFNEVIVGLFTWLYDNDPAGVTAVSEPIYEWLREHVLLFKQTRYQLAGAIGLLFTVALLLNLYRNRFWCRYICPLGALLGFAGKHTLFRLKNDTDICNGCTLCVTECQGAADPFSNDGWKASECFFCWNCAESCPHNAIGFGFEPRAIPAWLKSFVKTPKKRKLDIGRRTVLTAAGSGALAGLAFAAQPLRSGAMPSPSLIRPPGALPEAEFQDLCIRCGACMKVCPTNMLQPTLLQAGVGGIWSPVAVPRLGSCEYDCTLCGQICPTGAIQNLPVEIKKKSKMGQAFFDPMRCLPYAWQKDCLVCEEHCPTSPKAIWFEDREIVKNREGAKVTLKVPHVDPELCIGCGICEDKCPIADERGIRVTSVGETRHPKINSMFIDTGYETDSGQSGDSSDDQSSGGAADPYGG